MLLGKLAESFCPYYATLPLSHCVLGPAVLSLPISKVKNTRALHLVSVRIYSQHHSTGLGPYIIFYNFRVCHCSTGSTSSQATTELLVYVIVDGQCSFDELVGAPLPQVEYSGSSKSVNDRDPDRGTHPTQVLRYENYNDHVKERLQQADVQV